MSVLAKLKDGIMRRPVRLTREEYLAKLTARGLHPDGTPILDPTPIAPPIGYKKHPSMVEIVRDMVRSEKLAAEAAAAGHETFEESEDFAVGDDGEQMRSPWENEHDPDLAEILKAGAEVLRERKAREQAEATGRKPPRKPPAAAGEVADPPSDGPTPPTPDADQDD